MYEKGEPYNLVCLLLQYQKYIFGKVAKYVLFLCFYYLMHGYYKTITCSVISILTYVGNLFLHILSGYTIRLDQRFRRYRLQCARRHFPIWRPHRADFRLDLRKKSFYFMPRMSKKKFMLVLQRERLF